MEIRALNSNVANFGQPARAKRIDVCLTDNEYDEIQAAAMKSGTAIKDYVRLKLLEVVRRQG